MYKHYRNDKEFKIEKEIEEMAKVIFERGVALESIDFIHGTEGSDHFERIATALYNAGYRKIPENAVVLTRERYDYLSCWYSKFVEICDEVVKQVRKEKHEYNKSRPYKHGGKKC